MKKAYPVQWQIFLDESGDFSNPAQSVAVAGLLFRRHLGASATLGRNLRRAVPTLPWPLHRACLQQPLFEPLVCHVEDSRTPALVKELAQQTRQVLDREDRPFLKDLATRFGEGRHLVSDLELAQRCLARTREGQALLPELKLRTNENNAAVKGVCIDFLKRAEEESEGSALLVAAGEEGGTPTGHVRYPGFPPDSARYLELLRAVIRRAALYLEQAGEPTYLQVTPLTRDIFEPRLGLSSNLRRETVQKLCWEAMFGLGKVKAEAGPIPSFRGKDLEAEFVLADWVCSPVRRTLSRFVPLAEAERAIQNEAAFPVRGWAVSLSLAAAGGACQDWIDAFLGAEPVPPPEKSGLKPWAAEQADEWTSFLRQKRSE